MGLKFAVAFGIAVLFPSMIYYGVGMVQHPPSYRDFVVAEPSNPTPDQRRAYLEQEKRMTEMFETTEARFARLLFWVSSSLGLAVILLAGFISVSAVGAGLVFRGIFAVAGGYYNYWDHLADWMRFAALAVALAAILFLAFRKLRDTAA